MSSHASLSPSGAHRWMACPGSVRLEAAFPDRSSPYAAEGTAAHQIAAYCLVDGTAAADYIGETLHIEGHAVRVTDEMAEYVQSYADFVRTLADGKTLLVEQSLDISRLTGEPDAAGTGDAVIIDAAARTITVIDLKYGAGVPVSAQDNPQLLLYALAAMEEHSVVTDFEGVVMAIHQPRVAAEASLARQSAEGMAAFSAEVHRAAEATRATEAPLVPGEKQCRFCKAQATCPARREEVLEAIGASVATAEDFAQFHPEAIDASAGDNWLAVSMAKVEGVEAWCRSVRAEVERRLLSGALVPGYKLVEGRRGNRAWTDEAAAESALKAARLKTDEMYERKLISPTKAEKLLKDTKPKVWGSLERSFISRADGKPSVAPATDKRPPMAVSATAQDFADFVT